MVKDLPDGVKWSVAPPEEVYPTVEPEITVYVTPVIAPHALIFGDSVKAKNTLATDYLKQSCVIQPTIVVASPTGTIVPYEGGYACRALIYKAGAGEVALAKSILDRFVQLQNPDGSWFDQYYPVQNAAGLHDKIRDLKVDSGAALMAWAMADYDISQVTTVYELAVRKAMGFLRELQYSFQIGPSGIALLANLVWEGTYDDAALAADCAESLLAMKYALDAYGADLTTDPQGYSVATMANDLYYAMANYLWTGDVGRHYHTGYPPGEMPIFPFTYKEGITFTQALCAWAIYVWAKSAYNTAPDYSAQCEKALDRAIALCAGRWGGYFYSPYLEAEDETQNEFAVYTGLMVVAMNAVNSTKYAQQIALGRGFIQWLAMADGRVYDFVRPDSKLVISQVKTPGGWVTQAYSFLALNSAIGLLAGA